MVSLHGVSRISISSASAAICWDRSSSHGQLPRTNLLHLSQRPIPVGRRHRCDPLRSRTDQDAGRLQTRAPRVLPRPRRQEPRQVRPGPRYYRTVCTAGQLSPQPARPQPCVAADFSVAALLVWDDTPLPGPCELDEPGLAWYFVLASAAFVGTEGRRLRP